MAAEKIVKLTIKLPGGVAVQTDTSVRGDQGLLRGDLFETLSRLMGQGQWARETMTSTLPLSVTFQIPLDKAKEMVAALRRSIEELEA